MRLASCRYTTMFQEEEAAEPIGFLAGGRPFRSKTKSRPQGSAKTYFDWSGITLSIFVLVRKYSPEFAVANVTHKSLCCDLLLWANRRFGATKAPPVQNKKQTTRVCFLFWSGLRGSNPPPPPWQGGALPNELNPQVFNFNLATRMGLEPTTSSVTG